MTSSATIICSDQTRNGKTLFAKLVCDLLTLRQGLGPVIFDTDAPDGGLVHHYGGAEALASRHEETSLPASGIVDPAFTPDHVRLFDSLLSGRGDYVIDLSARHLRRFFEIYEQVDFEAGAAEAELSVSVFYILDRGEKSLVTLLDLARRLSSTRFVPVRNAAFGDALGNPDLAAAYARLAMEREIALPELSGDALAMAGHPDFHFDTFIAGRYEHFPFDLKSELWMLLETLYSQRDATMQSVVHPV
ncbi:MAG: hypothetical protein AAF903_00810 [Pseudomonadota bacterium]